MNESDVHSLEHVTLADVAEHAGCVAAGSAVSLRECHVCPYLSTRAAISQVIGNQSYKAPFPSINYEDLGLNLKATPIIHSNTDVSLKLEINIRTLGGQSVNGIPIINNREYVGSIYAQERRARSGRRAALKGGRS